MLKRDIVIKTKFALVDVLGAMVVILTMHLDDFLPVGLPQGDDPDNQSRLSRVV